MATTLEHASSAEERAWDLFRDALDPESEAARRLPSGAAFVAADSPDRGELVRRYKAEGRAIVIVDAEGHEQVVRAWPPEAKIALVIAAAAALALLLGRGRVPA
jgi:hypothetical protein